MKIFLFALVSILISGCSTLNFGDTKVYSSKVEETQKRNTVIVLHSAGGPELSTHWVDIFHNNGYNVFLLDYITGRGYRSITGLNAPININAVLDDVGSAVDYISTQPWHKEKIIIIGFSFGGGLVTSITDIENLKNRGSVNYEPLKKVTDLIAVYPFCGLGLPSTKTKANVQFHFGTEDWWTHESACMLESSNQFKVFRYKDARHGWDCSKCSHPSVTYNSKMTDKLIKNIINNLN